MCYPFSSENQSAWTLTNTGTACGGFLCVWVGCIHQWWRMVPELWPCRHRSDLYVNWLRESPSSYLEIICGIAWMITSCILIFMMGVNDHSRLQFIGRQIGCWWWQEEPGRMGCARRDVIQSFDREKFQRHIPDYPVRARQFKAHVKERVGARPSIVH